MYRVDSPHFFHQPYSLAVGEVVERLIRMNQNYKVQMQHAINMNTFGDDEEAFQTFMLEQIHRIDYLQPWGDLNSFYAIEKSFTWLDWLIIEKAISEPTFEMSNIADKRKMQLAVNILPDGKGILHCLAALKNANNSHIEAFSNELFQMTKQEVQHFLQNVEQSVQFEIPILYDLNKQSPLDICLDIEKHKSKLLCPQARKFFF